MKPNSENSSNAFEAHFIAKDRIVARSINAQISTRKKSISPVELEMKTILLISSDTPFLEALRGFANRVGQLVVHAECLAGAFPILQAVRPRALLLDLDQPKEAAWHTAEDLLGDESCPPVILLTARREQFDMRAARRSGSVVAKTETPSRLLQIVEETVATRNSNHIERNAIQRILIRWLRPRNWSAPVVPSHRFWGINE
jgi:CheY-like chemotaxis protein